MCRVDGSPGVNLVNSVVASFLLPFLLHCFVFHVFVCDNLINNILIILVLPQVVRTMQNILSQLMALMCGALCHAEKLHLEQKSCLISITRLLGRVKCWESAGKEWLFGREA